MRKTLIAMAVLFCATNAQAFNIINVDYTGNVAERIDMCGYGCGVGGTGGYIGGPVANNSLGGAFQFSVDKPKNIDYLLASAHVSNHYTYDQAEGMEFYFKLYTGTLNTYRGDPSGPYPDAGTLVLEAPMYVTTYTEDVYFPDMNSWHTFFRDGYYSDVQIPFNYNLKPGTYWLARERNYGQGGPIVDDIFVEFGKGKDKIEKIVNPEPATLLLFGSGIVGAFLRKRRA